MTDPVHVQAKGQVTIPKRTRDDLGIEPGDEVIWIKNDRGRWELWTFDDLNDDLDATFQELPAWTRKVKKGYRPKARTE